MPEIVRRVAEADAVQRLVDAGCDPRLARLFAARGLDSAAGLKRSLDCLVSPDRLANSGDAARLLADAIARRERLLVIADYDADGATACAVAVKALRAFGATIDYLVPNRFEHGYGLTPEIVREAASRTPDILITVDNGIAALDGIAEAHRLGMRVLVTDHHLPGASLPPAACIVNPNQPGCDFPSKSLAGVGVIFYTMLQLRAELRRRGAFSVAKPEPNLAALLDLVALGTVADVVRLDANNRILVAQGLARIRAGRASPGIAALLEVAGRVAAKAAAYDLAFAVGPRLNAAGRLTDMSLGIECLLAGDGARALDLATKLDRLNRERREIESSMQESAIAMLENISVDRGYALALHRPEWHAGVVGLLASRLRERYNRPVFAFAADASGKLKGSGRSIPGLHLRDALDLMDKRAPGMLERFGGHAAAAGATIDAARFADFGQAFETVARELLGEGDLEERIETDGKLAAAELTCELAQLLQGEVWGQGFPEPRFDARFIVQSQRVVGDKHVKLVLGLEGKRFDAIRFNCAEPLPREIEAVFRLDVDAYSGTPRLQLAIEHWRARAAAEAHSAL
ncbi:MAG TPA: single-stranded-DNA-specific exonuclease RecJ [Usitatibacter sp.]|jgi:single-stranded-DNA-specific exonuclease|nr:single-stranded-DNA-specific exonuclease RecJ [Usitatibacter sp.]